MEAKMKARALWVLLAAVLLLQGCALKQLEKESGEREQRIKYKEEELLRLQSQEQELRAEKERTLADLQKQQGDLDQLSAQLAELEKKNKSIKAGNDTRRHEQQELSKTLKSYQQQIAALKKQTDLSEAAKKKKIEELNQQIKEYLKRGL
jgi:chromosome segregation ATPase